MLDFYEAQSRWLEGVAALGRERVSIDVASGRVLARDVDAQTSLPPFDASTMDGYAIDVASGFAPRPLEGESRAGGPAPSPLRPGTASRVFTGAMLPPGADAVVMQEDVDRDGPDVRFDRLIAKARPPRIGDNVRRAGDDLRAGDVAIKAGTPLRAAHLPLLSAIGRARVEVYRRPVVAILATGDELREVGARLHPGTIVESIGSSIATLVREAGGEARLAPIVGDDAADVRAAIDAACDGADVLVTIGGVSVGDHDVVKAALVEAGFSIDFWRVAMKPGKPLAVGRRGALRTLGLPGNPVSAFVTFTFFGAPLVRALAGYPAPIQRPVRARLAVDLPHAPGRLEFSRATLDRSASPYVTRPLAAQASGSLVSLAWADALVVIPADSTGLAAGELVDVYELGLISKVLLVGSQILASPIEALAYSAPDDLSPDADANRSWLLDLSAIE